MMRLIFYLLLIFPCLGFSQEYLSSSEEIRRITTLREQGETDSAHLFVDQLLISTEGQSNLERVSALYLKGDLFHDEFRFAESLPYFIEAQELNGDEKTQVNFQIRTVLADSYHFLGEFDNAREQLDYVIDHARDSDSASLGIAYYGLYKIAEAKSENEEALRYLYQAHDIFEGLGQKTRSAMLKSYIGVVYHRLDNDSMALESQQEALNYFMEVDDSVGASFVYLERGQMYYNNGQYALAETDHLEGIALAEEVGHLANVANGQSTLGDIYVKMGRYDEAEKAYNISLELCEEHEIPIGIATCNLGLAGLYLESNRLEEALSNAQLGKAICMENSFNQELIKAHGLLAKIYAQQGVFDLAYQEKLKGVELNDSIFSLEQTTALGEMREKYEREKNLRAIADLERQQEVDELKRKGLVLGLGFLALLSIVVVNREIQRRKKAKQLHEAEKKFAEAEHRRLKEQLDHKNRELTSNALNMARKNEFLTELDKQLRQLNSTSDLSKDIRGLQNQLRIEGQMEDNWSQFTKQFTETNPAFYASLKDNYPDLSKGELRMAALLRMNLNNKDVAHILNISDDGVKKARYRLRKKLNLQTDDSLEELIMKV